MSRDPSKPHIVFTGGGAGGHLFPGLAIAEELTRRIPGIRVSFVGRRTPLEWAELARAGYPFVRVNARPLPRRPWQAVGFLANHVARVRETAHFLRESAATLVVGLGGYASVPAAKAAISLELPLVLLEQNAVAGRANRWLSANASLICCAFELERPWKCDCPVKVVGNPVRQAFAMNMSNARRGLPRKHTGRLVVLGGSQGADTLNEQVPRALYKVGPMARSWQIIHQSGQRAAASTSTLYHKLGLDAEVRPLLHNLPQLLADADLVISRAGGSTLAELAASGVPAVLLPYPAATNDHQRKNADRFVAAGAARMIDVRDLDSRMDNRLAEILTELMGSPALLPRMAVAMGGLAKPAAAPEIATSLVEVIASSAMRAAG